VRSMSVRSRLGVCGSASSGASVALAAGSVAADWAAQGAPSSALVKLKTTAKAERERIGSFHRFLITQRISQPN
jgi:hypothetical protein